jgi:gamma-glutamyltranspeptidase/glutathione hydrolase/leukotriene-C4 hydrolase
VLIALMNLLSPFKIPQTGGLDKPLNVHRFLEALKFAFGARSWVTDPAYVTGKDRDRLDEIWTQEWADAVRPKIQDVSCSARGRADELLGAG